VSPRHRRHLARTHNEGVAKALRGILHRVVILTQYRETKDRLVGTVSAGLPLDLIGTPDTVAVETIYRFKGLEADATIGVLDRLEKVRDHALAYIGLSRARFHLVVIGPPDVGASLGLD
jgi:hypothetical protein